MKRPKYNARKTEVDGIVFDSTKEARRYKELAVLVARGEIFDLQRQVGYELIPSQREPDTVGVRGGIKKGKVIEKAVVYKADFTYITKDGEFVCEDVKGFKTPEYRIKRKLMLERYGIRIKEI